MSDTSKEALLALCDQHASQLAEHFDSVRIFCTKHSEEGTSNTLQLDVGRGNFYAQLGQVHEFLEIQRQYQKNWAIKKDSDDAEDP